MAMKTSTALATDIDLAATLARHEVLLQQILLAVQALQSSRALSRSDRERLAKILPVLGAVFGDQLFTSREVTDSRAPGLRLVCKGVSVKQLGKLFRRAEGQPIGRLTVVRVSIEAGAIVWKVLAC